MPILGGGHNMILLILYYLILMGMCGGFRVGRNTLLKYGKNFRSIAIFDKRYQPTPSYYQMVPTKQTIITDGIGGTNELSTCKSFVDINNFIRNVTTESHNFDGETRAVVLTHAMATTNFEGFQQFVDLWMAFEWPKTEELYILKLKKLSSVDQIHLAPILLREAELLGLPLSESFILFYCSLCLSTGHFSQIHDALSKRREQRINNGSFNVVTVISQLIHFAATSSVHRENITENNQVSYFRQIYDLFQFQLPLDKRLELKEAYLDMAEIAVAQGDKTAIIMLFKECPSAFQTSKRWMKLIVSTLLELEMWTELQAIVQFYKWNMIDRSTISKEIMQTLFDKDVLVKLQFIPTLCKLMPAEEGNEIYSFLSSTVTEVVEHLLYSQGEQDSNKKLASLLFQVLSEIKLDRFPVTFNLKCVYAILKSIPSYEYIESLWNSCLTRKLIQFDHVEFVDELLFLIRKEKRVDNQHNLLRIFEGLSHELQQTQHNKHYEELLNLLMEKLGSYDHLSEGETGLVKLLLHNGNLTTAKQQARLTKICITSQDIAVLESLLRKMDMLYDSPSALDLSDDYLDILEILSLNPQYCKDVLRRIKAMSGNDIFGTNAERLANIEVIATSTAKDLNQLDLLLMNTKKLFPRTIYAAISAYLDQDRLDLALLLYDSIQHSVRCNLVNNMVGLQLIDKCLTKNNLYRAVNMLWIQGQYSMAGKSQISSLDYRDKLFFYWQHIVEGEICQRQDIASRITQKTKECVGGVPVIIGPDQLNVL